MATWRDLDRPSEILWFGAQTVIALLLGAFAFATGHTAVGLICSSLVVLGIAIIAYVSRTKHS